MNIFENKHLSMIKFIGVSITFILLLTGCNSSDLDQEAAVQATLNALSGEGNSSSEENDTEAAVQATLNALSGGGKSSNDDNDIQAAVQATLNALSGEGDNSDKENDIDEPASTPSTSKSGTVNDYVVCIAYQHLLDVWPTKKSWDEGESRSAQTIYRDIEEAALALKKAGETADNSGLKRAAEIIGQSAYDFIQLDQTARDIGFIPYFEESLIGGEDLNALCAGIGQLIELH